jgi:hypothetical protein
MIAGFILFLSMVVLVEFSIAQWRSMWMSVAAMPLSQSLQAATGIKNDAIGADDFERLVSTSRQLCPTTREGSVWMKEVRIYYRAMRGLASMCEKQMPALSAWAKNELVSCSKYAAVVLDQRINANLAFAAEVRNY